MAVPPIAVGAGEELMTNSRILGGRRSLGLLASIFLVVPGLGLAFQQETKAAAEKISATLSKQGRKSVAVVDFTDLQGSVTELGRFMAEQLSVALASEDRDFKVIDRGHLRKILREQGLGSSGVIDPTTAQEVGRIAGVDTLITGTLTPFGETVSLSIKALDTKTAENIRAMSVEIPKTNAIAELLGRGLGPTEAGSAQAKGGPPAMKSRAEATTPKRVEVKGFLFELRECSRPSEMKVVCDVLITNREAERELWLDATRGLGWTSECIDTSGRTTPATLVRSGSSSNKESIGLLLYSEVPTRASFEFDGVDPSARTLRAMTVSATLNWQAVRATMHDIPIGEGVSDAQPRPEGRSDQRSGAARFWGIR